MAYCGQNELLDYFNWSTSATAPEKTVICPLLDVIPPTVLALFVFGAVGLALTFRVRHPAPILVAGILTGGVAAINAPGAGINILAIVIFVGIAALGMYIYSRASSEL